MLDAVLRFTSRFFEPAVAKLDPSLIHKATIELRVAERYALAMLGSRRVGASPAPGQLTPDSIVRKLVKEFPTHGYVIGRDEAEKLGLTVEPAERHPRWSVFYEIYKRTVATGDATIIEVIPDVELDKAAGATLQSQGESNGADQPHSPNGSPGSSTERPGTGE